MKKHPKLLAEHLRLQQQMEDQKRAIQEDWQGLRASLRPLQVLKSVVSGAADSFRDNSLATQSVRLALTLLPRRTRQPWLAIAAQMAIPILIHNLPHISAFIAQKAEDYGLTERLRSLIRRFSPHLGSEEAAHRSYAE